jgi:3-phenylpropionate/trans-cinnamate dioxygenase ferredoxin component
VTFHLAIELASLPSETLRAVQVANREILLVRRGESVWAVAGRCSHEDARLAEGYLEGDAVECPRHGARFDLQTGRQQTLPATRPIATYPVRLAEGAVWIGVSDAENDEV